ncbi:DUF1638 domain-containing protein [Halomonas sp. MCCC 1A17488]|jgi:hypothetical protein|uniref:DUF1638 domain-containing protein n=3 Tax=Halomonadaceae TaxID=28256 RepID=A0A6I6SGF2_9GAMM|nr:MULTISPECIES: DUF1638 domain-containing protein [Halomonas]MCE8017033.1 DUF1638 domain-containing protein [Halomonas sp. MCCC 1A17488]MCE8035008.1 DUF1638 domain-containing protein [Halomonas sp. MCCC 1A11057]MCG3240366.1 DUF1638 domain-containing protein [Halomonas sp. MCCC 1A17488]QHC48481.1 DUF1638 domain-containing protein [Halomonas tianxiuensis]QPP49768.1 DUF1638 domain-containing protein [Halomonas sp. SS10-MC5]
MSSTLIIACGALAREIMALIDANDWHDVRLECLPADLHNRPDRIPEAVGRKLREASRYSRIFVAYADCGTGGLLDEVLAEHGAERLPGAHCYDVYAGESVIAALSEQELGTFYLTDFLVRHFDRLVIQELGIEHHPQLASLYFGQYRRLVYLSQRDDPALQAAAQRAAARLGLSFEYRHTGYGELATSLVRLVSEPVAVERAT